MKWVKSLLNDICTSAVHKLPCFQMKAICVRGDCNQINMMRFVAALACFPKGGKKRSTLLAKPSQTWHSLEQRGYYSRSKSCGFIAHLRPHSPKQLGLFYDSHCWELIHNQHFLVRHIYKDLISLKYCQKKTKKTPFASCV